MAQRLILGVTRLTDLQDTSASVANVCLGVVPAENLMRASKKGLLHYALLLKALQQAIDSLKRGNQGSRPLHSARAKAVLTCTS